VILWLLADDVDDVGNTQGSVDEVGCVNSEGGGGKEDLSPPPSPPVIPSKAQGAPHRMFSVGLPPVNCLAIHIRTIIIFHCNL